MPIRTCILCGNTIEAESRRDYCSGRCFRRKESEATRQRRANFSPERKRATNLVWTAIWQKKLFRQPCEVCGKKGRWNVVAHHDDYAAPLDVRWLCRRHHIQHHQQHGPGKNAFCEEISA